MPDYDLEEAQRILGRVADELGVREVVDARASAAKELLACLLRLNGKVGVRVGEDSRSAVQVGVGERTVFVRQNGGKIRITRQAEDEGGEPVPLTFDPLAKVLLGPAYETKDPVTGETKTKHRDALATVAEAVARALSWGSAVPPK